MYSITKQLFKNVADQNVYNYQQKALKFDKTYYKNLNINDTKYFNLGDGYFDNAEFSAFMKEYPDAPIDFSYKFKTSVNNLATKIGINPIFKD